MELPESLLHKEIDIQFADGTVFRGEICGYCDSYYIEIMKPIICRSSNFGSELILECGKGFVKVSFFPPPSC